MSDVSANINVLVKISRSLSAADTDLEIAKSGIVQAKTMPVLPKAAAARNSSGEA